VVIRSFRSPREEGQGLVEYALILVLVAIVVIAILLQLGPVISDAFCKVTDVLQPGSCDTGVITITSGPTVTDLGMGSGPYKVSMTIEVAEPTNGVTLSAGGQTSAPVNCNTTCSLEVNNVPSGSGTFTISAGSLGSKSGTY
jgi:pilus assembly protein Flp/PilA